ncbi:MAG: cyclic peptide export ABC transporter [Elainellaceae cyanobacterium]
MKFIRFLLRTSWLNILLATIAGLASGGCNAKLIALVNQAVTQASIRQSLLWFFALVMFTLITSTLSQFMLIHLSQNAIYRLRLKLSENILFSPLQHLERLGGNRLLATLTDDVRVLSHAVSVIPNICIDLATIIGCLVYLAWLSNSVFVVILSITFAAIWCIYITLYKAQHLFIVAREEEDQLFKHFQAITTGTKELKLHQPRRNDFLAHDLQGSASKMRQKNIGAMRIFALADSLGQFLLFTILGFTLFILPRYIDMSIAMLSTYALTTTYLAIPFQNLLHRLPDLLRGNVALRKIERMQLALINDPELAPLVPHVVSNHCQLDLEQVSYLYHPDGDEHRFCLGPISLSLQPGQITYIVGGNGSGKSTLAKLITGLYLPDTGTICLNGNSITDQNQEWYRQHFSAIFSDFHLFERCLGFYHDSLDQDAAHYLKQLHLDHKVQIKGGVLSTTKLSLGQQKRLALLTAYLEDRPIYLFDEWASDQDPYFRDLFYREILIKLKESGKTVIVITHDDRYFHLADQIIKLDYGKIQHQDAPSSIHGQDSNHDALCIPKASKPR